MIGGSNKIGVHTDSVVFQRPAIGETSVKTVQAPIPMDHVAPEAPVTRSRADATPAGTTAALPKRKAGAGGVTFGSGIPAKNPLTAIFMSGTFAAKFGELAKEAAVYAEKNGSADDAREWVKRVMVVCKDAKTDDPRALYAAFKEHVTEQIRQRRGGDWATVGLGEKFLKNLEAQESAAFMENEESVSGVFDTNSNGVADDARTGGGVRAAADALALADAKRANELAKRNDAAVRAEAAKFRTAIAENNAARNESLVAKAAGTGTPNLPTA